MIAVTLTDAALDACAHLSGVADPSCGAGALFSGIVRNHHHGRQVDYLIYEAYQPMAVRSLRDICDAARARFEVTAVACWHRTGEVKIGEASVVIAVSAPHRAAAFDACRFVIEEIKRSVPVWKRELFE